jgi:hypothetical protein
MTNQSDAELLKWWREWLKALDAQMCAVDQREGERRHKRVVMIQHTISKTPSRGLTGVGVKLALTAFLDGFEDDLSAEPALSAYLDTTKLLDRDFLAEAEAIVERSREREVAFAKAPLQC